MPKVMIFEGHSFEIENQINSFLDSEEILLEDIKYQVTLHENYGRHEVTHYAMVIYKNIGFEEVNQMNDHYPPGVFQLPGEKNVEQTYIFEVGGEIEVEAYSEEDAEYQLQENLRELVADAVRKGHIEIN